VSAARTAFAILIAVALTHAPARAQEEGTGAAGRCGTCHPSERVAFEASRHAQEDVGCVACHGGNDRTLDSQVAHSGSFRGRPSRRDIPRLCATCHSDEDKMRPYNLPVDQYALYQTSGHGRALARGNTRVAVCSDCHGAHDILPPSDARSRVYALNIPKTCGACHGDTTAVGGGTASGKLVYGAYAKSVHARALIQEGNLHAPTCVSCHGVHGAAPSRVGDVDKVCGQCHAVERRYFESGPHAMGLASAGQAECVSCHASHDIEPAQPQRLGTVCADCHSAGSAEAGLGERMWTEYRTAGSEIDKAESLVQRAEKVPLNTEDYRARLVEARTLLREALPAAHAVNADVVSNLVVRARSVGQEVESEIYAKLGHLQTRRLVLVVFWFYVLLTVLVLRRFQRAAPRP